MRGRSSFSLKKKLFVLIGVLGLIPLLGASLTYALFTVSKSADKAMEAATHGAVYNTFNLQPHLISRPARTTLALAPSTTCPSPT